MFYAASIVSVKKVDVGVFYVDLTWVSSQGTLNLVVTIFIREVVSDVCLGFLMLRCRFSVI